jgi:hypothetical protein
MNNSTTVTTPEPTKAGELNPGDGRGYATDDGYAAQLEAADARARGTAEAAAAAARAARAASSAPAVTPSATPAAPPADPRQQAIDNVISALAASGANTSHVVQQRDPNVIFNSADDSFTVTRAGHAAAEIHDSTGLDPAGEVTQLQAQIDNLQAKLDAGKFDPVTGQLKHDLTGSQRDVALRQLAQVKDSARYQVSRLDQLVAQRATASGSEASLHEQAVRMSYIDSAPPGMRAQFAADYDRAMSASKAKAVTDAVMAARRLGVKS